MQGKQGGWQHGELTLSPPRVMCHHLSSAPGAAERGFPKPCSSPCGHLACSPLTCTHWWGRIPWQRWQMGLGGISHMHRAVCTLGPGSHVLTSHKLRHLFGGQNRVKTQTEGPERCMCFPGIVPFLPRMAISSHQLLAPPLCSE